MIRNSPEYLLEDGSPRYGIRTAEYQEAPAAAAVRPDARVEQVAEAAALLDGAELRLAADHRHVLDRITGDAPLIQALREEYPEYLREAEAIVAERLGPPKAWAKDARTAFQKAVGEEAAMNGTLAARTPAMLGYLALQLGILTLIVGMAVNEVPLAYFLAIFVGLHFALRPTQRKLTRTVMRGLPTRVGPEDARELWDAVVNATLLAVLAGKGITVDPATDRAARRGWNHLRYVASVAQDLRTNYGA